MPETEVQDDVDMPVTKPLETSAERAHSPRRWVLALVILAVVGGLLFFGIRSRIKAEQKLTRGDGADGRAFGDSGAA